MNVLILGSGGREHALAWKISQSRLCDELYIAPGNAGTLNCGTNVNLDITNFEAIGRFALEKHIGFILPGPEAPLVAGIYDHFKSDNALKHICILGPSARGAMLEGSKDFAKQFMNRHGIPTARHLSVTRENVEDGCRFIESLQAPYVLKADGLAAGKGVIIVDTATEACQILRKMLGGMFGAASQCVVVEEYLHGIELSVFFLTDGDSYLMLPEAKDYKRIGENNTGPNTGGMGSVSPVPFATPAFMQKVEERIVVPTVKGLKIENIDYKGFVFAGLMNVNGDPYVIEYNVRMGDPETESVLPRIKNDLFEIILATAGGNLGGKYLVPDTRFVASVMLVSGGYPESYEKGKPIDFIEKPSKSLLFHAGTVITDGNLVTAGGRVLAVSAYGKTLPEALQMAYSDVAQINYDKKYYRCDIGADLQ
ncbi:MAG TPA: phosphoribosylamine--glycine ligase [Bacteroidales bacterium]|nr:phosphoribosylamine--glycine ligase [Bacteroidales bacterium]HQL69404.1 phosphoribosylamine--glycine ligase [Bacteroidales bacterium]